MSLIDANDTWNNRPEALNEQQPGKEEYNRGWNACIREFYEVFKNAPTIDAAPVAHGRWDDTGRYIFANKTIAVRCDKCGCALTEDEFKKFVWNYCPNCGARMDGDAE